MALPDFKVTIVDGTGALPDFRVAVVAEDASPRPDYIMAEADPADFRVQIVAEDATPQPDFRVYGITAFTPTDLGDALLAWWDADEGIAYGTGSDVASWTDRKAGLVAAQATAGSRPSYSATGFNGAPGLTFDGTADCLLLASPPFPIGADPCEIWAVVQQDALGDDATVRVVAAYADATNNARRLERTVVTAVNRARASVGTGAASVSVTGSTVSLSSRHVMRAVFGATQVSLQTDGNTPTTAVAVPSTLATRFRIGANAISATAGSFWNGKIRDVIVTGALTTEQAAALTTYLLARRAL